MLERDQSAIPSFLTCCGVFCACASDLSITQDLVLNDAINNNKQQCIPSLLLSEELDSSLSLA